MTEHLPTCAMGKPDFDKCSNPIGHISYMAEQPVPGHWWSGWPGAFCLRCHADDPTEECISGGCRCPCHDEFWKEFSARTSEAKGQP